MTPIAQAIDEFLNDIGRNEKKDSPFYRVVLQQAAKNKLVGSSTGQPDASIRDLESFIDSLDATHKSGSKALRLTRRLDPLTKGLAQYVSVADVVIQAAPSVVVVLYGGARLLLQQAQQFKDCYDAVIDVLVQIGKSLQALPYYTEAYSDDPRMHRILVSCYKNIVLFWQKAADFLSKKHSRNLLRGFTKPLTLEWTECREALEADRKEIQFLERGISAKEQKEARDQKAKEEQEELKCKVANWIKGPEDECGLDCRATTEENVRCRHPSTGTWLFQHPKFLNWIETNDSSSLLLLAPPGAGKTLLASAVAHQLQGRGLQTAAFYCTFSDSVRKHPINALRSLSRSLLPFHSTELPGPVVKYYKADAANYCNRLNDLETAIGVFNSLLNKLERVHIILDGLDEWDERKELLRLLDGVLKAHPTSVVKWLFTSRDESDIRKVLRRHAGEEISASIDILTNDISRFMRDNLDLSEEACHTWSQKSEGNFLWASLFLRTMKREGLTCEEDIMQELDQYPTGLNESYLRVLHRLAKRSEHEQDLARKVFSSLTATQRPLRLAELRHAIAAMKTTCSLDWAENRLPWAHRVEELCSNLVVFDRSLPGTAADPQLKFVHKTIHDFFLQEPRNVGAPQEVGRFFTTPKRANLEFGRACLQYLRYQRYSEPGNITEIIHDAKHAFIKYATSFWYCHFLEKPNSSEVCDDISTFVDSPMFWHCTAVQSHVAPHLFARFHHPDHVSHYCERTGSQFYAFPLPIWMKDDRVKDMHEFVKDWSEVLASYPDGFGQCIMDESWRSRWRSKSAWESKYQRCLALDPGNVEDVCNSESPSDGSSMINVSFDKLVAGLQLLGPTEGSDLERRLSFMRNTAILGKVAKITSLQALFTNALASSPTATHADDVAIQTRRMKRNALADTNDPEWRRQHELPANLSHDSDWRAISWSFSQYSHSSGAVQPVLAVRWRLYPEDESDKKSVTSSDSSDSEEEPTAHRRIQHCLTIIQQHRETIFIPSEVNPYKVDSHCVFHPTEPVAIWSPSDNELCVINLETGGIDRTVLPEPTEALDSETVQFRKDFYFSPVESRLYYLFIGAKGAGEWTVSISTFETSQREIGLLSLRQLTSPATMTYTCRCHEALPALPILVFWETQHVYIALPPLSSRPKFVRFPVTEKSSQDPAHCPTFETFQQPIFFPASTPDRSPMLHYISSPDGTDMVVLSLTSGKTTGIEDHPLRHGSTNPATNGVGPRLEPIEDRTDGSSQAPLTVMAWELRDKPGWKEWDPSVDGKSDAFKDPHHICTYLKDNEVFAIPARSESDWREAALLVKMSS